MAYRDPDQLPAAVTANLVEQYQSAAKRLKAIILHPPGNTAAGQEFNRARAASQLAQVAAEIHRLKASLPGLADKALRAAMLQGQQTADRQLQEAGVGSQPFSPIPQAQAKGSFSQVDHRALELLARDTIGDLSKAADSMGRTSAGVLRRMAATGVSNADVNKILAGGMIEGKPREEVRALREELRKVYGGEVTITDKNGDPMTFKVGYYASMVAVTKTREASCKARHGRLASKGIDLVVVQGRVSKNFCSAYLGKVFSLSGGSKTYPPLSSLPSGGPPFHPNCSKGTAPFIEALADPGELEAAEPDPTTDKMLGVKDTTTLQHRFQALHLQQDVVKRMKEIGVPLAGRKGALIRGGDPKNTDPQFVERLLTAWGVGSGGGGGGVDLKGRKDIAAAVASGMQRGVSAGMPRPTGVLVGTQFFAPEDLADTLASVKTDTGVLRINPSWPGWKNAAAEMAELHRQRIISSARPDHAILHELAHLDAVRRGANYHKDPFTDPREILIARSVSLAAAVNKDEFLAEVGAARLAGVKISGPAMALYRRLMHV